MLVMCDHIEEIIVNNHCVFRVIAFQDETWNSLFVVPSQFCNFVYLSTLWQICKLQLINLATLSEIHFSLNVAKFSNIEKFTGSC